MPKVGAHVSAAISLDLALDRAKEMGAEAIQIFVSPPRKWSMLEHSDKEFSEFKRKSQEFNINPNFIHGTYLVSLGTQYPDHLQKSIDWLVWAMQMAEKLGSGGVIFHPGSYKGREWEEALPQIVEAISVILNGAQRSEESPTNVGTSNKLRDSSALPQNDRLPYLILENSAGAGATIGANFKQLGEILKGVGNPRLKVCLDTQHSFASGYDVKSLVGLKDVLEEFNQEIGLENLAAIHCNDSKTQYKSLRDRHENIGEGFIGREGFENMINHPSLKDVPFILEVPGFADNGPDAENVEILKSLRKINVL